MKNLLLLLILCMTASFGYTQNVAPVISNLSTAVDTGTQSVTLTFDLADAEGDDMDLWIQVSADGGATWLIPTNVVSGDVGFPVNSGTGKSIVWTYDPDSIDVWGGVGPYEMRVRVIADDRQPVDIADIVAEVDSAALVANLTFIEGIRHRTTGAAHLAEVRDTIEGRMDALEMHPEVQTFDFSGYTGENYIGRWSGVSQMKKAWLLSGHYDTVDNSPGADDNGSATAALWEAMRLLSGFYFKNSLKFIAFDLEEEGLKGSIDYVSSGVPAWEETQGLLNLEMIGYYDDTPGSQIIPAGFDFLFPAGTAEIIADSSRGNFITNVGNTGSDALQTAFHDAAATYVPALRVIDLQVTGTGSIAPDLRRSDHAPFWDASLPALMLTDGANFRNANYHTADDDLSTINFGFMTNNVRATVATLATLAEPVHCGVSESESFLIEGVVGVNPELENALAFQAFPNPSNGAFNFSFHLSFPQQVRVYIVDAIGKKVVQLNDSNLPAGDHNLIWDGRSTETGSVAAGIYFVVMEAEIGRFGKKLQISK